MEYNTTREPLLMKEYGRHIQKMVDYLMEIEDADKRQEQAEILIELMGFLNPGLKNIEDFRHKLWDHLFYMSNFKLKVSSPYPIPTSEEYNEKPAPLPYPKRKPRFAHLGRNLEALIKNAKEETDPEKKNYLINNILYYIKLAYSNWHKEQVSDEAIAQELKNISGGALQVDEVPHFKYKPSLEKEDYRTAGGNMGGKRPSFALRNNKNNNKKGNNNRQGGSKNMGSFGGGFKKKYK